MLRRLELPLAAVVFCLLGSILSWPWSMVSALVAIVILLIAIVGMLHSYFKRRKRSRLLKEPFEAHFLIPTKARCDLGYVQQDDQERYVDTLTLPANSTPLVLLSLRSKLDFEVDEAGFGCEGSESKPEALEYFNYFMVRGKAKESPETNPNHSVDWHGYYHIRNLGWKLTKGEVRVGGFIIKTTEKGTFPFRMFFHSPEGRGGASLTICVSEQSLP